MGRVYACLVDFHSSSQWFSHPIWRELRSPLWPSSSHVVDTGLVYVAVPFHQVIVTRRICLMLLSTNLFTLRCTLYTIYLYTRLTHAHNHRIMYFVYTWAELGSKAITWLSLGGICDSNLRCCLIVKLKFIIAINFALGYCLKLLFYGLCIKSNFIICMINI